MNDMICGVEALENGLVVRFHRVVKQKRQIPPERDFSHMARLGARELGKAMRNLGEESWKKESDESDETSEKTKAPAPQEVYTLQPAAIFVKSGADDDLVKAVAEAKAADDYAKTLGLHRAGQWAPAVLPGIGLSQGCIQGPGDIQP